MDSIKTVDELIAKLQTLKERAGGDCRVMLRTYGRELMYVHCYLQATGKSDPYHLVSRGGVPCVVISE